MMQTLCFQCPPKVNPNMIYDWSWFHRQQKSTLLVKSMAKGKGKSITAPQDTQAVLWSLRNYLSCWAALSTSQVHNPQGCHPGTWIRVRGWCTGLTVLFLVLTDLRSYKSHLLLPFPLQITWGSEPRSQRNEMSQVALSGITLIQYLPTFAHGHPTIHPFPCSAPSLPQNLATPFSTRLSFSCTQPTGDTYVTVTSFMLNI